MPFHKTALGDFTSSQIRTVLVRRFESVLGELRQAVLLNTKALTPKAKS